MAAISSGVLQELSKTLDKTTLDALSNRLGDEISKQPKPQTNSDFYSTKTSLLTVTSPGLRRPVRSNNRKRHESPAMQKFSKTVGISSLEPSKQRAIYYHLQGDLPNLHSQDLLNTLYNNDEEGNPEGTQAAPQGFFRKQFENINRNLSSSELSNLKQLQLYFCNVESFRSLGTGWKIRSLSIVGSAITDFSGISGFALIEELYVPFNRISDLSQLSYHQSIRVLDLQGNLLADMDQIDYLETVEGLEYLDLEDNPLMESQRYREDIERRLQHRLQPVLRSEQVDYDDLWEAYHGVEDVCALYPTIDRLMEDRTFVSKEVLLSLQQERPEDQQVVVPTKIPHSIYKDEQDRENGLEWLHRFHNCKWSLNDEVLTYLNSKLSPQNMVTGSRSRSKPKLAQIDSKDKLDRLALKQQPSSTNDSELRDTKQSVRDSIRSEAKKKFQVRKSSLRKELVQFDAGPLTESVRLRPGRLLLKSCLNKL